MRTVLVTGVTGRLGGRVAETLRDHHGIRPRVLARRARVESGWTPPDGVDVAIGDYDEPASLAPALDGVDALFLVSPVHPDMRKREGALAEVASRRPRPPHVVKVSGLGTRMDSPVDSGRWHAEIERDLRERGVPATFLRPFFFMQNLGMQTAGVRTSGVLRGGAADAAIAMVDARDVADVAAAVLAGGTPIEGEAVPVTGPEALDYEAIAAGFSDALGTPVRYEPQTPEEVAAFLSKVGMPAWHARILLQFNAAFARGEGSEVSGTVARVLGRTPRSLSAYLGEIAAEA